MSWHRRNTLQCLRGFTVTRPSPLVLKSSIQVVKCPRGLNEDDFLARLRSTFPQLTAPFEVFTTDASRKLVPLKTRTLTPENIYRSIKSSGKGRSALYIQIQVGSASESHQNRLLGSDSSCSGSSSKATRGNIKTQLQCLQQQQQGTRLETGQMKGSELSVTRLRVSSVDSEEPPPGEDGALFSRMSKQVTLRVCLLKDNPGDVLKKSGE